MLFEWPGAPPVWRGASRSRHSGRRAPCADASGSAAWRLALGV